MTTSSGALFASPAEWAGPPRIGPLRLSRANASVRFSVRFLRAVQIRGSFETLEGSLTYDEAEPSAASLEARVEVASIVTGNRLRDAHLRSPAWLDARRHPHIEVRATRFERVHGGISVAGTVAMRGQRAPVVISCTTRDGSSGLELLGRLTVARSPHGVGPRPYGVAPWDPRTYLVDDAVSVELRLRLAP